MSVLDISVAPSDLQDFFAHLERCRDKNPLTHGLHPYPAKFIPHIPRVLIRNFSSRESVVYDPMCGSGTTLVEAITNERYAIGSDSNPIATLISRAKTTPLPRAAEDEVRYLISDLSRRHTSTAGPPVFAPGEVPHFPNRNKWFSDTVLFELASLKRRITRLTHPASRDIALCCFSAILVAVSNQESETRWCAKPNNTPIGEPTKRLCDRLQRAMSATAQLRSSHPFSCTVTTEDARNPSLSDLSVDLVVTSPPYMNSHDYYLYNKLRLFWLDYDVSAVERKEIGSRHRHSDLKEAPNLYVEAMQNVLVQSARVLKPGGFAAFVVADSIVRGEFFRMNGVYDVLASKAGFDKVAEYSYDHRRFTSTFSSAFGTRAFKETHVLIYQKPAFSVAPPQPN